MALPNDVLAEYFSRPLRKKPDNAANVFDEPVDPNKLNEKEATAENAINEQCYSVLGGAQLVVLHYIFTNCHYSREKRTKPLSIANIAYSCDIKPQTVKKTIQRLEKKGLLSRGRFKAGRGGWTQYELPDSVYFEMMHAQSRVKLETDINTRRAAQGLPVETPVVAEQEQKQPEQKVKARDNRHPDFPHIVIIDGEEYDIEPLADIGFTHRHLEQVVSQKLLEKEVIQESIYAYAFDLKYNNKRKEVDKLVHYIMAILRNGRPYVPAKNYESPHDMAMRIYLESVEQRKRRKEEKEREIMQVQFEEWLDTLTDAEKDVYGPAGRWDKNREMTCRANAFEYFRSVIWPPLLNGMREHLKDIKHYPENAKAEPLPKNQNAV
jgi:hypothetical protein